MLQADSPTCVLGWETDDKCSKHAWSLLSTINRQLVAS